MWCCICYIEVFVLYYWYRFLSNGIGCCEEIFLFIVILELFVYIVGGWIFIRIFGFLDVESRRDKVQLWIREEIFQEKVFGFIEGEFLLDNNGVYNGDGFDIKFRIVVFVKSGVRYFLRCVIFFSQSVIFNKYFFKKELIFEQIKFVFENLYYGFYFIEVLFYIFWNIQQNWGNMIFIVFN